MEEIDVVPPSYPPSVTKMSPDPNANDIPPCFTDVQARLNGDHKQGAFPGEVLGSNGLSLHSLQRLAKTGGSAEEVPTEIVCPEAAIGDDSGHEEEIEEYLQRSDTAIIYPEPVEQQEQGESVRRCIVKTRSEK